MWQASYPSDRRVRLLKLTSEGEAAASGVYKNMTRGIIALVFRSKITGGRAHNE